MDIAYTYATRDWQRVMVYAAEGLQPPDVVELTGRGGELVEATRISDRSLVCQEGVVRELDKKTRLMMPVTKKCKDPFECHKHELGVCKCGIHDSGHPMWKAADDQ